MLSKITSSESQTRKNGSRQLTVPRMSAIGSGLEFKGHKQLSEDEQRLSKSIVKLLGRNLLGKIGYIEIHSSADRSVNGVFADEEKWREYPASQRRSGLIPGADVALAIAGKNYGNTNKKQDNYILRFGALALTDKNNLAYQAHFVRYEPYKLGEPTMGQDEAAAQAGFDEVFGTKSKIGLGELATISLGLLLWEGGLYPTHPNFNQRPFGLPIADILHKATSPVQNINMNIHGFLATRSN